MGKGLVIPQHEQPPDQLEILDFPEVGNPL